MGNCQHSCPVASASAWLSEPRLLLGDEPTGNLDSVTTGEIMALFDALHREGQTVVLVTHEPAIAAHCLRQLRLVDGRIIADLSQPRARESLQNLPC